MKPTLLAPALLALSLLSIATPAWAVSPTIRGISPVGGQRGTEVNVTFSGQRLADSKELLFYQPGISVTKLEAGKDDSLVATLKIASDAPLGLHDFRLRTATGISPLKTFSVGVLKEVTEAEPNNDFEKPQSIPLNVTINGVADREDIDYYAITAKKGERITAEVEGIRLGLTLFDPYVAILDTKRFELKTSDDSALIWVDGLVSVIAPEDGTYVVAVRESAYNGNAQCLYRLHVGNFPRPTALVPAGGKLGEPVTVHWIGDVLGETTTKLVLPDHPDRNFGLIAHDDRGTAPYPNSFRLSPFGNILEAEPNDTPTAATVFTPPLALNGVIGTAGDVDCFSFAAKKGQTYDVRVYARQIRSPLDAVMTIAVKNGGNIARNDDSGGPDSYIRFNAPKDGDYVVSLVDHLKKGGPDYAYRVEISPVAPKLTLSTPNEALRRGIPTQALAIPRGNRQAILINATRAEFGGALALAASNLPAGVTFETDEMAAGAATIPVVFKAESSAPVAATLAQVTGKPVDTKLGDIPTAFQSTCELVLGQNNVVFWSRTVDALAVAVTEEAPFSIEVVEPKVPIVRGGAMDLKVVAKRKAGFTAPIAIQLPWNPPGISSKQDIVIAENEDSATIPVNANNGAELRTWKIVVNGTYTEPPPPGAPQPKGAGGQRRGFGRGRLTVSSDLAKLTVAAPYLALKFDAASVEQGKDVDLAVDVEKLADFPGEAKVTLVGLPNKVTTDGTTITKDTNEMVFHLKTDEASPPGETKNLFCQVIVMVNGEPIVHNLGAGRLRIDKPIVKKATDGAGAKATVTTAKGKPSEGRPLSRLEKLRLETKERARAKEEGGK